MRVIYDKICEDHENGQKKKKKITAIKTRARAIKTRKLKRAKTNIEFRNAREPWE